MQNLNEKDVRAVTHPYTNPTPGEIPVVCITPFNEITGPTATDAQTVVDCGFNIVAITQDGNAKTAINLATQKGLKSILARNKNVSDPKNFVDLVEEYKTDSNIPVLNIYDEPSYSQLQDTGSNGLRTLFDNVIRIAPNKMAYFNLSSTVPAGMSRSTYLNNINSLYYPFLWSFDFYPISTLGFTLVNQWDFLYELLIDFSNIAQSTGKPFWYILCCTQYTGANYSRPLPTKAMLTYQAFAALAMGAQGIGFWHYNNRPSNGTETYQRSPITNGVKTEIWDSVQSVIREIRRYQTVFLGCNFNGFTTYGLNLPNENQRIILGPISSISYASGQGALVTSLSNNGYNYIVFVNIDPFAAQTMQITYDSNYASKYQVMEMTPNFAIDPIVMNKRTLNLEAGGFGIIRWR